MGKSNEIGWKLVVFELISLVHILAWVVVVLGCFVSRKLCYFSVYYLIPLMYFMHIFEIHVFEEWKKKLIPDKTERDIKVKEINERYILPMVFHEINKYFDKSFRNPFSVQGKMIFGMIVGVLVLGIGKCFP